MRSIELEVRSAAGLHARPAAEFVRAVAGFSSAVRLENLTLAREPVDARSVIGVLTAGIEMGHRVRLTADGSDERRALDVLGAMLAGSARPMGR